MEVKKPERFCMQIEKLEGHGCVIEDFEQAMFNWWSNIITELKSLIDE